MSTCFLESPITVFIQRGSGALSAPIVANGESKQRKKLILESLMVKTNLHVFNNHDIYKRPTSVAIFLELLTSTESKSTLIGPAVNITN